MRLRFIRVAFPIPKYTKSKCKGWKIGRKPYPVEESTVFKSISVLEWYKKNLKEMKILQIYTGVMLVAYTIAHNIPHCNFFILRLFNLVYEFCSCFLSVIDHVKELLPLASSESTILKKKFNIVSVQLRFF